MHSFNLIFNLDKNLFIMHSCWSWCMSQLSSCCFSSQMRNSYMLRDCEFMNTLILKKRRHCRGLRWPDPHKTFTGSHIVDWKIWETHSQPEHDILPAIPLFFFSEVAPAPRAGMTHPFHCAGNTKGREEVVHWDHLTANWPFPYCSL